MSKFGITAADIVAGAEAIKRAVYKRYAFELSDQESKKIAIIVLRAAARARAVAGRVEG